jgi:hypothetical protein
MFTIRYCMHVNSGILMPKVVVPILAYGAHSFTVVYTVPYGENSVNDNFKGRNYVRKSIQGLMATSLVRIV